MPPSAASSAAAIIAEYSTLSVLRPHPLGTAFSQTLTLIHRTNLNYCGLAGFGAILSVPLLALRFSCLSTLVLILHDYLVTFRQEVNMFWTRKLNGAAILFYLNRYAFITVYAIYQLTTYAPISDEVRSFLSSPFNCLHTYGNHLRGVI